MQPNFDRSTGIGGSDCHHLFSLEPYGCARRMAYEKSKTPADYPDPEAAVMRRGHALEPLVIKLIRDSFADHEMRITQPNIREYRNPDYLYCHPDAIVDTLGGETELWEAKTVGFWQWKRLRESQVLPDAYMLQVQHSLLVTGLRVARFGVLWADGWQFESFPVEANAEIQESIKYYGREFWENLKAGHLPARLDPEDPRCQRCPWRTTCQGKALLDKVGKAEKGLPAVDGSSIAGLQAAVDEYFAMLPLSKEADELLEAAKTKIQAALDAVKDPVDARGARIYYRPQTSMRLNAEKAKAAIATYERWSSAAKKILALLADHAMVQTEDVPREVETPDVSPEAIARVILGELGIETVAAALEAKLPAAADCYSPSVSRPLRIYAR